MGVWQPDHFESDAMGGPLTAMSLVDMGACDAFTGGVMHRRNQDCHCRTIIGADRVPCQLR